MKSERIGVIGLGLIGGAVAQRLINTDYEVYVYDTLKEKKEEFKNKGAIFVNNIQEMAERTNVIITSLPNDKSLKQVMLSPGNFDAKQGIIIIELSTILPNTLTKINNQLPNIDLIDCPISGGPKEAASGTLSLIVSGKESVYNNVKPILKRISNNIFYLNQLIGDAKALKLVNNIMTLGNVLIASSAFSLGVDHGLNSQKLYDVLSQTGGSSHHFVKRFSKVIEANYSPLFSIKLGMKDLELALKWADSENLNTEIIEILMDFYQKAINKGFENEDIVSV